VNITENIRVAGHPYGDVSWHLVEPIKTPKTALGYRLDDHVWAGGEIQADLLNLTHDAQPDIRYAVKIDTSEEAIEECRARLAGGEKKAEEEIEALGIGQIRRLKGDEAVGDIRIALEGLDEAHLIDRLTGAVLKWHAQNFGPGPSEAAPDRPRTGRAPG
jgi:hypothetical protein